VSAVESARSQVETPAAETSPDDARLVEALRARDEAVFVRLVREYGPSMQRVATLYVRDRAVAEEVVQEAWLGVLKGIDRFEGRSSFKTWLFRILTNTAQSRGERERRSVPFSALARAELDSDERSVEPEQFRPDSERWAKHWISSPRRFGELPEERLLGGETMAVTRTAIEQLPEAQRAVITLRDITGCSSEEVCATLDLSEGNQRVLLHRARTKVRRALEQHFDESESA
jgi:RNA polymerase sigma-70 factor (ECF subfamily)